MCSTIMEPPLSRSSFVWVSNEHSCCRWIDAHAVILYTIGGLRKSLPSIRCYRLTYVEIGNSHWRAVSNAALVHRKRGQNCTTTMCWELCQPDMGRWIAVSACKWFMLLSLVGRIAAPMKRNFGWLSHDRQLAGDEQALRWVKNISGRFYAMWLVARRAATECEGRAGLMKRMYLALDEQNVIRIQWTECVGHGFTETCFLLGIENTTPTREEFECIKRSETF